MIAVVRPQIGSDLLDPFRNVFGWLRPSEPWGFVLADECSCVLMIVRELESLLLLSGLTSLNGTVLYDPAPLACVGSELNFISSASHIML